MAALTKYSGGLYRVDVNNPDGSRPSIRLGRIPVKQARVIQRHIERLQAAKIDSSAPPEDTSRWLAGVSDSLRARIVALGLAGAKVKVQGLTVAELVEAFKDRAKWREKKAATHASYGLAFKHILAGLGSATSIADVTETRAEDLHCYLYEGKPTGAGLARASANRMCDTASMLFRFAVRSRLLSHNPFDEVHRGVVATSHLAFVDAETSRLVIDAMKDSQWRLLVALGRWGGLRVPSEPRLLRWGDINREDERFTVTSPKTAHHEGHGSRVVPIFPELAPYIDERFDDAEPGELVLPMMVGLDNSAFRNQLDRTVRKLGLDRWPRIFHNLRSTRQTELEERFPSHVVCKWLGNSERIARRHYLQVTEDHFAKAQQKAQQHSPESMGMTGNNSGASAAIPGSSR